MHYLFYKVNKPDIAMIKFLLETYENMFQVSTVDKELPKIQITVAPDMLSDALAILDDLKSRFYLEQLDEDSTKTQANY